MTNTSNQFRVLPAHLSVLAMERLAAKLDSGVMAIEPCDSPAPDPSPVLDSGHQVAPTLHTRGADKVIEQITRLSMELPAVRDIEADVANPRPGLYARDDAGKWFRLGD